MAKIRIMWPLFLYCYFALISVCRQCAVCYEVILQPAGKERTLYRHIIHKIHKSQRHKDKNKRLYFLGKQIYIHIHT